MKKNIKLSVSEKHVIDYLYENEDTIEKMTVKNVADKVFYSSTTVTRALRKIGFNNLNDFKIQAIIRKKDTSVQKTKIFMQEEKHTINPRLYRHLCIELSISSSFVVYSEYEIFYKIIKSLVKDKQVIWVKDGSHSKLYNCDAVLNFKSEAFGEIPNYYFNPECDFPKVVEYYGVIDDLDGLGTLIEVFNSIREDYINKTHVDFIN